MKLIIEKSELDSIQVELNDNHRWIDTDGFFEVKAEIKNIKPLSIWNSNGDGTMNIYLGTNFYRIKEEENNEYQLGLPRIITLREFINWFQDDDFENTLESLNETVLGNISDIQFTINQK